MALLVAPAGSDEAPPLERFASAPLPSSGEGVRFAIGFPGGWEVVQRGERTLAIPPGAPSRRDPTTFVEVLAIARDDPGSEGLLANEVEGLDRWLAAVYPRFEVTGRAKVRLGGLERPQLELTEKGQAKGGLRRRAIVAHLAAADVHFVIVAVAPESEFAGRAGVYRSVIESLEVKR